MAPQEAVRVGAQFGVAVEQVRRDHLIWVIFAATQAHAEDLVLVGGTALSRTSLPLDS